jgi:hypothetical protein
VGITNDISDALVAMAIARTTCKSGYSHVVPNTFTKKFPFWTAWPFQQEYDFQSNVEVGSTIEKPSFWIMHYIIHTDINANIDAMAAHTRMNDDVDDLMAAWGHAAVVNLIDTHGDALVTTSGDRRTWKHNPDGPFVQFAGRMVMGSYGLISVVPPTIAFGCL